MPSEKDERHRVLWIPDLGSETGFSAYWVPINHKDRPRREPDHMGFKVKRREPAVE